MNSALRNVAGAPSPLRGMPRGSRTAKVLLVDDDPFILNVIEDMLRDLGVGSVTKAVGGTAAIKALDYMPAAPELVMCDLNMPAGDGFQFMEELGKRGFSGAIALMSGMDLRTMNSAALMARFHRLRVVALLGKPISTYALGVALANLD